MDVVKETCVWWMDQTANLVDLRCARMTSGGQYATEGGAEETQLLHADSLAYQQDVSSRLRSYNYILTPSHKPGPPKSCMGSTYAYLTHR